MVEKFGKEVFAPIPLDHVEAQPGDLLRAMPDGTWEFRRLCRRRPRSSQSPPAQSRTFATRSNSTVQPVLPVRCHTIPARRYPIRP